RTQAAPVASSEETFVNFDEPMAFPAPAEPSEVRRRLDALEARFLAVTGPLDAPERQTLWPELAELNTALGQDDASVCWLHALWSRGDQGAKWVTRWLRSEAELGRKHGEARAALAREPVRLAQGRDGDASMADLDRLLILSDPTTTEARSLRAHLPWDTRGRAPLAPSAHAPK